MLRNVVWTRVISELLRNTWKNYCRKSAVRQSITRTCALPQQTFHPGDRRRLLHQSSYVTREKPWDNCTGKTNGISTDISAGGGGVLYALRAAILVQQLSSWCWRYVHWDAVITLVTMSHYRCSVSYLMHLAHNHSISQLCGQRLGNYIVTKRRVRSTSAT